MRVWHHGTARTTDEEALSRLSGHLCPSLLAQELEQLKSAAVVYITHLMPGEEEAIMAEIHGHLPDILPLALRAGMLFEL
jgi:hypothetical protein